MLILYRSLTLYLPQRGPAGTERKITLWWQPGGLQPGIWWMAQGGGQAVSAPRSTMLDHITSKYYITNSERDTLLQEMATIDTQDGPVICPDPHL